MINNKEEKQHTDKQLGELRLCIRLLIHYTNNNKINVFWGSKVCGVYHRFLLGKP